MPRRWLMRLTLAFGGLVALAAGALAVLIMATSAPVLPPPPLPTATAQPGPDATPLGGPLPGPDATPLGGPLPGPDATPFPAALALPGIKYGVGADPNGALRALGLSDPTNAGAVTGLVYRDATYPGLLTAGCGSRGEWTLQVDPEHVIGRPYSEPPSAADWDRAATVIATATSLCPAPIVALWFAHDTARPASDRWLAILPPTVVAGSDGPTLRAYALGHARQL